MKPPFVCLLAPIASLAANVGSLPAVNITVLERLLAFTCETKDVLATDTAVPVCSLPPLQCLNFHSSAPEVVVMEPPVYVIVKPMILPALGIE